MTDEDEDSPDDIVARKHFTRSVVRAMRKLSHREQAVIRLRFGISEPDENEDLNMGPEIAAQLTREKEDVISP